MKFVLKTVAIIIVIILLISSIYIAFYTDFEEEKTNNQEKQPDNGTKENTQDNKEGENEEDEDGDNGFVTEHTVFIEEASATTCVPCTMVASILNDLYKSGEYNFHYVSLVQDKNDKAKKRLEEYNVFGVPVVYIDSGYKVFCGGGVSKSDFVNAINDAISRNIPNIKVNVTAEYNENTTELSTTVYAENNEVEEYTGRLKVYLTEIISRWNQANNEPYHYALVDYVINKEISIDGKNNITELDKRKINEFGVSNLDSENLMMVAVIFNSESAERDSFPTDESKGKFDAYFADATDAALIVPGGNLPPIAGISIPETDKLHIFSRPVYELKRVKKTVLVGKTKIVANVEDDTGVEKVEFYIDGKLKNTDTSEPYEYIFSREVKFLRYIIGKHVITVKAYDNEGKTNTVSMEVITFY